MAKSVVKKTTSILRLPDYMHRLNSCYKNISIAGDYYSLVLELNLAYNAMKMASSGLVIQKNNCIYEKMLDKVIDCEDFCSNSFILESKPIFNVNDSRFTNKSITDIDKNILLDYIVWFTRDRLLNTHQDDSPDELVDFNKLHLTNDCRMASNIVKLICDMLRIECEVIKIPPAFTDEYKLYGGNGFHYFCLVKIDGIKYIIDTTYRQFFTLDSNNINRLGVMGLDGCNPGVYMLMNNSRKKTAINILKKGYVVANDENLKNYFDGFLLSYRNGLYYEWNGKVDYNPSYTVDDYFKFINGDELLFDYEPIDFLGNQEQSLKNPKFRFKI
jgi:hypothetical protein